MVSTTADKIKIGISNSSIELDAGTRMPLRIGFLMDHPSPHMQVLLEAIAARKDCTLEVVYCGRRSPQRNWESAGGRIPHSYMNGVTGPLGLRFNPEIFRTMSRLRADVWIVNTVYGSLTTLMAAAWLHFHEKPWAFMNEPVRPRSGVSTFFKEIPLRFVLNRTDGIIASGKAAVDQYKRRLHRECPCVSVPYFIDLSPFFNLPGPLAPAKDQDLQFVTACQMIRRKGVDCLLQACKGLPDSGWHLTLVGDGPLRKNLETEFADLVFCGKISFVGDIPYIHRAMAFAERHVFLFPSRWDGWGMVLPEALAAGLPVVSTDRVTSAHEFIKDGVNGFIIPADSSEALADKMRWFLENTPVHATMSRAARKSIENYRPDLGADTLVAFLRQLSDNAFPGRLKSQFISDAECNTWRILDAPRKPSQKALWLLRRIGKDAVIRGNLAIRRHRKAKGHLILGYHLVLKEDRAQFEDHLKFFSDYFQPGSLQDLLHASEAGNGDTCRLAITFDDGFRILMQDCLELLEKYGIKAGFYVPTAFINLARQNEKAMEFSIRSFYYRHPLEPMHPEDLKKLTDLGHEVGSHGLFHTSVHALMPDSARKELELSRSMISGWTGSEQIGFSYPYGELSNSQGSPADWLRELGFAYGLAFKRGCVDPATDPFALPRHHAEGNWPIRTLKHFLLA